MKERKLHIVAFDIPYPPVYGGVIDVYYKLKALASQGVRVTLHAFYKDVREVPQELNDICGNVILYPRRMDRKKAMGTTPFIMASRFNDDLVRNLELDDAPILMEGMHSASILGHPAFTRRHKVLRMHNIEWAYYRALAKEEKDLVKKWYFRIESMRLQKSAHVLKHASHLLAISQHELEMLSARYDNCHYLPPFHGNTSIQTMAGKGNYALYHGNLGVGENRRAAEFLIREVFSDLSYPLKIAGSNAPAKWLKEWDNHSERGIEFILHPQGDQLSHWISNAQMNVLPTFQETGVKLKLINSLYQGRHCIVNRQMVKASSLGPICHIAANAGEFREKVLELAETEMTQKDIEARTAVLSEEFDDCRNAARLIEWLYPDP